jgi:hypothetical protein
MTVRACSLAYLSYKYDIKSVIGTPLAWLPPHTSGGASATRAGYFAFHDVTRCGH